LPSWTVHGVRSMVMVMVVIAFFLKVRRQSRHLYEDAVRL